MTKEEFISKGKELGYTLLVTDQEYKDIEYVYTFHPSISETEGKKQIAELYATFGFRIIKDMLPTARKAEEYENLERNTRLRLEGVKEEFARFKRGELD